MKRKLLPIVCLLLTFSASSQTGLEIIRNALGRIEKWDAITHVNYQSLQTSYNKWQSYDYFNPSGNKNQLHFSYDLLNSRYFYTTDSYFGGGYHFSFANIGKDSLRYTYDRNQSRDGKKIGKQGKAQFAAGASFLHQFIPYYLLKNLVAKNDSLYRVNDASATVLRRDLKQGGHELYYFNAQHQLTKFVLVQATQQTERVFKEYKVANGLSYPSVIDNYVNGTLLTHDSLYNVTTSALSESKLQLPAGYKMDTAALKAKVSMLANKVYLIENVPGGRNMLFVELRGGIFVTEAPLSAEVSQAMIDIIHKTLPGRPIKYVHLSHFHNDHTNGIRSFAAEGATIVAADYTINVIRTIVDDSSGKFKDKFAEMHTAAQYQTLRSFNESVGKNIIELHEMPNNHAKGLSFVYLPREKVIYEGDLYSLPSDGTITPAIEITRQFYHYLKHKKLKLKRIIGHHGHSNITPAIFKQAIQQNNK